MEIMDCKAVRAEMLEEVKSAVASASGKMSLVIVQVVGDDASEVYVKNKEKTCKDVGIQPIIVRLPQAVSYDDLASVIRLYNGMDSVTGFMLQLPLPDHLKPHQRELLDLIDYKKDVDGLCSASIGRLWAGLDCITPATPTGIMYMLPDSLAGKNVTIIGRSDLVGKPLAKLMMDRHATVTLCHSKTVRLEEHLKNADIVVSAVGKPVFLCNEDHDIASSCAQMWFDVGMNRDEAGKLCGDIKADDLKDTEALVSSVPGGVGLLTTAQLMRNVVKAYQLQGGEGQHVRRYRRVRP